MFHSLNRPGEYQLIWIPFYHSVDKVFTHKRLKPFHMPKNCLTIDEKTFKHFFLSVLFVHFVILC
jgi:hypothetical protein